jgi:hypothetical protein
VAHSRQRTAGASLNGGPNSYPTNITDLFTFPGFGRTARVWKRLGFERPGKRIAYLSPYFAGSGIHLRVHSVVRTEFVSGVARRDHLHAIFASLPYKARNRGGKDQASEENCWLLASVQTSPGESRSNGRQIRCRARSRRGIAQPSVCVGLLGIGLAGVLRRGCCSGRARFFSSASRHGRAASELLKGCRPIALNAAVAVWIVSSSQHCRVLLDRIAGAAAPRELI